MVSGTLAPLYTVFWLKLACRLAGSWALEGGMDGRMDGRTYGRMENLPILQDFVPYRGRCPAAAQLQPKNCIKRGKGTTDHMMPLGNWLKKWNSSQTFWKLFPFFKIDLEFIPILKT